MQGAADPGTRSSAMLTARRSSFFMLGLPWTCMGCRDRPGGLSHRGGTILRAKYYTREVLGRLLAVRDFDGLLQQRIFLLLVLRLIGNLGERLSVQPEHKQQEDPLLKK